MCSAMRRVWPSRVAYRTASAFMAAYSRVATHPPFERAAPGARHIPVGERRRHVGYARRGADPRKVRLELGEHRRSDRVFFVAVARATRRPPGVVGGQHRLHDRVPGGRKAWVIVVDAQIQMLIGAPANAEWRKPIDEQCRRDILVGTLDAE